MEPYSFPAIVSATDLYIPPHNQLGHVVLKTLKSGIDYPNAEYRQPHEALIEPAVSNEFVFKYFLPDRDQVSYKLQLFCQSDQNVVQDIIPHSESSNTQTAAPSLSSLPYRSPRKTKVATAFGVALNPSITSPAANRTESEATTYVTTTAALQPSNPTATLRRLTTTAPETAATAPKYIPKSVLLYISHPYFDSIWNNGAIDMFSNFFDVSRDHGPYRGSISEVPKDCDGYDLEIEIQRTNDESSWGALSMQCSKIRALLHCGPIQRFFKHLEITKLETLSIQQVQLRDDEIMWLMASHNFVSVVFSIHYRDYKDAEIIKLYCQKLQENECKIEIPGLCNIQYSDTAPSDVRLFIEKATKELPVANAGYLTMKILVDIFEKSSYYQWKNIEEELGFMLSGVRPLFDKIALHHRLMERRRARFRYDRNSSKQYQ